MDLRLVGIGLELSLDVLRHWEAPRMELLPVDGPSGARADADSPVHAATNLLALRFLTHARSGAVGAPSLAHPRFQPLEHQDLGYQAESDDRHHHRHHLGQIAQLAA